jgi:hypothetical protein
MYNEYYHGCNQSTMTRQAKKIPKSSRTETADIIKSIRLTATQLEVLKELAAKEPTYQNADGTLNFASTVTSLMNIGIEVQKQKLIDLADILARVERLEAALSLLLVEK